jgi:hypothetical protein
MDAVKEQFVLNIISVAVSQLNGDVGPHFDLRNAVQTIVFDGYGSLTALFDISGEDFGRVAASSFTGSARLWKTVHALCKTKINNDVPKVTFFVIFCFA